MLSRIYITLFQLHRATDI